MFASLNLPPISTPGAIEAKRKYYGRKRMGELISAVAPKIRKILDVDEKYENLFDTKKKINDFDCFLSQLQIKIKNTLNKREKISLLTATPESWSLDKAANFFNVTRAQIRHARSVKAEKGIFGIPDLRPSVEFPPEIIKLVQDFYYTNSRVLPGKKDYVSVDGAHKQKQLILVTLRELYALFKEAYPDLKIGFSKFCTLRPKECIGAGASGTHAICVCIIHQNFNLLLWSFDKSLKCKDIVSEVACDTQNFKCMMRLCKKCSDKKYVEEKIFNILKKNEYEMDKDTIVEDWKSESVEYKQWTNQDRSQLETKVDNRYEIFLNIINDSDKLFQHHYIAKQQSRHLKERKDSLEANAALILVDFSENFSFIIQDEIQSAFWSKKYCTIHPVVIYLIENGKMVAESFCVITEDLTHDTCLVEVIIEKIVSFLKENFPNITNVEYFSDGCAAQYKNCNIFSFLCKHKKKFGISASWSFFASCHGKSPCDGIGGPIKREASKESLRRPADNPIENVQDLYDYCISAKFLIKPILISGENINLYRINAVKGNVRTLPGTRSLNYFEPLTETIIKCKTTSKDENFTLRFDLQKSIKSTEEMSYSPMMYVSFVANGNWFIGQIISVNEAEETAEILAMVKMSDEELLNISRAKNYEYFKWSENPATLNILYCNISCSINNNLIRGKGFYKLNCKDILVKWSIYLINYN